MEIASIWTAHQAALHTQKHFVDAATAAPRLGYITQAAAALEQAKSLQDNEEACIALVTALTTLSHHLHGNDALAVDTWQYSVRREEEAVHIRQLMAQHSPLLLRSFSASSSQTTSLLGALSSLSLAHLAPHAIQRAAALRIRAHAEKVLGPADARSSADETPDFRVKALPLVREVAVRLARDVREVTRSEVDEEAALLWEVACAVGERRSAQLFDILVEFPESTPALLDLRECIEQTGRKAEVWKTLSQSLKQRLLHPGAPTGQIIQLYVHLIRSLRLVDPSGVTLSHVIGAVRQYLRARSDTISVLVMALLGTDARFALLRQDMTAPTKGHEAVAMREDADEAPASGVSAKPPREWSDTTWGPRPVEAGPDFRLGTSADVVQMLVSIFEDREGFVHALELSTANSLLQVRGYDTSKELEKSLILKRRFGDQLLARCDVMLDDIVSSKRSDLLIHSTSSSTLEPAMAVTHPLILSRQFWPELVRGPPPPASSTGFATAPAQPALPLPLGGAALTMPGQFARTLEAYARAFEGVKSTRKLRWLAGRGRVSVRLTMDDGRVVEERDLSALQGAVVEFAAQMSGKVNAEGEPEQLRASTVATALEVAEPAALITLQFWVARGVLRELDGVFEIIERL